MIITTAGRASSEMVAKAKKLSILYRLPYIERNGVSIETIKERYQNDIVVVGKQRLFISPLDHESDVFFHPNLAMVRAKRLFKGEEELLISTAKLKEGMSFLDCTLGLASDSIMASLAVGSSGSITGIEGNDLLFFLAKEGLHSFSSEHIEFDQAMRRINVIHSDHLSFLQQAKANSFDVVYFDPMFQLGINTSSGMNVIRGLTLTADLTDEILSEAKRVAKERVVLKDHWKSERFSRFGFTQHKRKTSLFHYGTLEVEGE